jgi:hypothetical protein
MGAGGSSSIPGILLAALLGPSLAVRAAESPPPAATPEFCASLARVLAAATAGIETLRGKAREDGEWDATEAIAGLQDCAIETNEPDYDAPLHSYGCVVSKPKEAAAADADQERLRRQVSQCLGDSWQAGETQHPASHSLFFTKRESLGCNLRIGARVTTGTK